MLTLNISEADLEIARYERFSDFSTIVQKRLHTLYIKATTELSHEMIAQIVGIHRDTVTAYIRLYETKGIQGIKEVNYGTNHSVLDDYSEILLPYFNENPPHTIAQACSEIERITGIKRCPTQVREWLRKHKFRYRKTGHIPAKADRNRQEEFLEQQIEPLIQKAENQEIHLLFLDAAHFVMGVFQCFIWSVKRVFIKSSSGRNRYNVLGAVNAITKYIHTFTNCDYINANCICDFFEQLRLYYNDNKPICIILDNARYQKCQLVQYVAWQFNIKLIYQPTYSPNLNIIERFWKWIKKEALYAKYYETFTNFKNGIDHAIFKANNENKEQINSLLSLNFQLF